MQKIQVKSNKAITLIALIITIIILLILAGVAINLTVGDNGIFKRAQEATEIHEEAAAREKLEIALDSILMDKIKDSSYNKNEYVDNKLKEQGMTVTGDIVTVDGWQFEIDRDKLIIKKSLGKGQETPEPEVTTYTIVYHKNDGSGTTENQIVEVGKEITLDDTKFTIRGYKIVGWYTNSECTGEKVTQVSSNIEVYAKWEQIYAEELSYLMTTGEQYVYTGIYPNQNTSIEVKYQLLSKKHQFIYGTRETDLKNSFLMGYQIETDVWTEGIRVDYNTSRAITGDTNKAVRVVKQEKNKLYIDGKLVQTFSTSSFTSPEELVLFSINDGGTIWTDNFAEIAFYYCKIWDGNDLVASYIPVIDNDGNICLYEEIKGEFKFSEDANKTKFEGPSENSYIQLEALEVDGTKFVDTGIKHSSNLAVEMKFKLNSSDTQYLHGVREEYLVGEFAVAYKDNSFLFDYGTNRYTYSGYSTNNIYTIKQDKNKFYINGTQVGTGTAATFSYNYNLYLFAINNGLITDTGANGVGAPFAKLNFYYCKIWDNGILVRDFIPILFAEGGIDLYDNVSKSTLWGQNKDTLYADYFDLAK